MRTLLRIVASLPLWPLFGVMAADQGWPLSAVLVSAGLGGAVWGFFVTGCWPFANEVGGKS